tara:strand:+ start:1472 stop:1807 length:336 start_codon:yes stop_codon:yes gene_type:complete
MKKVIVLAFCSVFFATSVYAARLPRVLKTPSTCKVIKVVGTDAGKTYILNCKKPLAKRMRGWVLIDKNRFGKLQDREWMSRRGNWRLHEESVCKLKSCKVKRITVYEIDGC